MPSRLQREEGKSEFLARARHERRAREVERRRQQAAGLAQRWWRGRKSASETRAAARQDWDLQMTNLQKVVAVFAMQKVPFQPPPATVLAFLQKLLGFYRTSAPGESARVRNPGVVLLLGFGLVGNRCPQFFIPFLRMQKTFCATFDAPLRSSPSDHIDGNLGSAGMRGPGRHTKLSCWRC